MKKLMFAIAAVAAGVAMADVTSANTVGYIDKKSAVNDFNYVAPTFIQCDGEEYYDIQEFQLDSTVGDRAANIQILDDSQGMTEFYYWFKASDGFAGPEGQKEAVPQGKNGLWFYTELDEETMQVLSYELADRQFDQGECVQLSIRKNKKITFAGAVSDGTLAYKASVNDFNYIGNPFPAEIDLQEIQLDNTVGDRASNIQILDDSQGMVEFYYWFKASEGYAGPDGQKEAVPEGKNGLWFYTELDEETMQVLSYELADRPLEPGEGVQLSIRKNKFVYITAPYEL